MATKSRLLIQGSSWTVGAYKPSDTPNSDDLVPGGLAELLSDQHEVTNISVGDDFNLGSVLRLREHLQTHGPYDKILICQNDPLRDLVVLRSQDHTWNRLFGLSLDQIMFQKVNTISKLLMFLLDKFYAQLSQLSIPTVVFAGPSLVHVSLAQSHGLQVIPQCWTQVLVPEFPGSYMETSAELDQASQMLQRVHRDQTVIIKRELCEYADQINLMLNTWRTHPELFAVHHPTALGNWKFYQYIKDLI